MRKRIRLIAAACTVLLVAGSMFGYVRLRQRGKADLVATPQAVLPHTSWWIAGTASAQTGDLVPSATIGGLAVAPDGTAYTVTGYSENHNNLSEYSAETGKVGMSYQLRGRPEAFSGQAVAANASYVYAGESLGYLKASSDSDPTGTLYPPNGVTWYVVDRYKRGGYSQGWDPFAGGVGNVRTMAKVSTANPVTALAVGASGLFAADAGDNLVHVYDVSSMAERASFAAPSPTGLAVASDGSVWVLCAGSAGTEVRHFSAAGTALPGTVADVSQVSAIALDPSNGHLLVADNGPAQQVRIYDVSGPSPALASTFGEYNGVLAGPTPGLNGPLRFNQIVGLGADSSGNLYVGGSAEAIQGTDVRKFTPDGKPVWHVEQKAFTIAASANPATDGADAYTPMGRYILDYSAPAFTAQPTEAAYTLDRFKYPNDPRLYPWMTNMHAPDVRVIQGRKIMFTGGMYGNTMGIFRFDGEIAVPSGLVTNTHWTGTNGLALPIEKTEPATGGWIWRDSNGDGDQQADEYISAGSGAMGRGAITDYEIDDAGNLWMSFDGTGTTGQPIVEVPMEGFDAAGNPIYDPRHAKGFPLPETIVAGKLGPSRIHYDPATDTLVMTAMIEAVSPFWGLAGTRMAAFSHFTAGTPTRLWVTDLPYTKTVGSAYGDVPKAVTFAGNRAFFAYNTTNEIRAYNLLDGSYVGSLVREAELNPQGWYDMASSIRAYQRSNGDYVLFGEDEINSRVTMYSIPSQPVSLKVRFATGSGAVSAARTGLTVTVSDSATHAVLGTAKAVASDREGAVSIANPAVINLVASGKTYDVTVGGGGYLPSTVPAAALSVAGDAPVVFPDSLALIPGDLRNEGKVTLTDILAGIRAYNGAVDTDAAAMNALFGRQATLADVLLLIKGYRLH